MSNTITCVEEKPYGFWSFESIIGELEGIIPELGHFPSRAELEKMDRKNLTNAMDRYGGFNPFRKKLDYETYIRNQIERCPCGKQLKTKGARMCSLCNSNYHAIIRTMKGSKMSEAEIVSLTIEKTKSFRAKMSILAVKS